MELERLLRDPRMMQAVLGMSREEFALLVPVLDQVWQQVLAERRFCKAICVSGFFVWFLLV